MAPAYKLIYFNARGGGESIRYLLKYGNIEFEDVRVSDEEWQKQKDSTPFGQLPLLEHNGKQMNQSAAICRYLGKLVKLDGKNDWENLEIDAVVDTLNDFVAKARSFFYEQDPEKKKKLQAAVQTETIPYYFGKFEENVKKNKGHLACGKMTWADIYFTALGRIFSQYFDMPLDTYPALNALIETVEALPAIKKWIAERPKTER